VFENLTIELLGQSLQAIQMSLLKSTVMPRPPPGAPALL
jgi:hypothetical protein